MLNNFITKEIKLSLSTENYLALNKLIKEENPDSILASLNKNLIKKYLEISIKSENLFFYICEYENEIIGYALLARQPLFLISEFKGIKYLILLNLLFSFKLKTIMNILLAMSKIDLFFISKEKRNIIDKTFNLNLLAIDRNFQSRGIGKAFVLNILEDIKKNNRNYTHYTSSKFYVVGIDYENSFKVYDVLDIHLKTNDKKYIIKGIAGVIYFI